MEGGLGAAGCLDWHKEGRGPGWTLVSGTFVMLKEQVLESTVTTETIKYPETCDQKNHHHPQRLGDIRDL